MNIKLWSYGLHGWKTYIKSYSAKYVINFDVMLCNSVDFYIESGVETTGWILQHVANKYIFGRLIDQDGDQIHVTRLTIKLLTSNDQTISFRTLWRSAGTTLSRILMITDTSLRHSNPCLQHFKSDHPCHLLLYDLLLNSHSIKIWRNL